MTTVLPRIRPADAASTEAAAKILRGGGLVAFPTETVYGLGADATNDRAVASIFAAKERPKFNPLIVHVHDLVEARTLAEFSPLARKLALSFWPGGLTLVLPRKADAKLSLLASAGLDTIALRVPANAIAQKLLSATGGPIAAPSANRSGQVSPTTAAHVADGLAERVDFILDGGPAKLGIESTIIGFENGKPVLLRPGAIPRESIEAVAGPLAKRAGDAITAPGQLESHYAPRTCVRLNARDVKPNEALLAFGDDVPKGARAMLNLSARGDLTEAAANLFAMLRELDAAGADCIAVMSIPEYSLGEAINDRLMRAAAGKP
jgi:L-threonylcarbamoyladenylate synthase